MNSNNTTAAVRSLIIYALCIPLAVWIGYLLAEPADKLTFGYGGILAMIFLTPILLRWHHFFLIAGWNFAMTIFFLPGSPPVWLLLTALSLGISVLHRTVNSRAHFISAPEITWPLLFFLAVILMTAKLTGGIGLNALGNEVSGGKHYVTLLFGIFGYFALTAQRVPPKRVGLYTSLFFLAGCSSAIGDLAPYVPSKLYFIFAFFPVNGFNIEDTPGVLDFHARYGGLGSLGVAGFLFMLCRYGARGILLSGKLWRWVLFAGFFVAILFGGYRSYIILCSLTFVVQFFLEKIYQTKIMPFLVVAGVLCATLLIVFADRLPYTFQRSLAFLPLNINQVARMDAEGSSDWRLEIWRDTFPQVPQYLLLGRGYALSKDALAMAANQNFKYISTADEVAISGNYHSGPLSVLMPFGIWGTIALLWFWIAGTYALYNNYRHGDSAFKTINIFLFAYFVVKILIFLIVFGALENDLANFAVLLGLSVSINGGIRQPAKMPLPAPDRPGFNPPATPNFQPLYQRKSFQR